MVLLSHFLPKIFLYLISLVWTYTKSGSNLIKQLLLTALKRRGISRPVSAIGTKFSEIADKSAAHKNFGI